MKRPKTLLCLGALLVALAAAPAVSLAQDGIEVLYNKSISAMNAGNWDEGLKLSDQIVTDHGEFALADYGPMFGGIYYNKGFCEMKLKKYEEASESFKACHEKFYNKKPDDSRGDVRDSINAYEKRSVFQWALCRQLAADFEQALELYEKFLELKPESGEIEPGAYFINLAICQSNVGRMADAKASLERVFKNQASYKVSSGSLLQGFFHLGGAWVRKAAEDPEVIPAANEFLDNHMAQLKIPAWEMQRFNPLIVQLAQQAGQEKEFALAMRVYSMYAGIEDAIEDLNDRAVDYGGITEKLQSEIDKLDEQLATGDPLDLNVLRGLGACYDGLGDLEAYYVLYQYLYEKYPDSKDRPVILYGATRGAAGTGDVGGTQRFGVEFIENFPDHELYDQVSSLMIGTLFQEREYETCVEIALDVRDSLEAGSKARDIVEFILGGSYYYLTQYKEAQPILDKHAETYPTSQYVVNSRYFQASNLMKLDDFPKAAALFDSYIADFPQSPLLDVALYERALCEYILQEEDFSKAVELVTRIENEFPESAVLDSALILKGDILRTMDDSEGAEASYMAGREAAERRGNVSEAGNALAKLVDVQVFQEKWDEAAASYDDFFGKYAEQPQKITVAVVGMDALIQKERTREGLDRLSEVIVAVSKQEDMEGLERAINSYVTISSDQIGVDATLQKLNNFPGVSDSKALKAWVLVSKIELLEGQLAALDENAPDRAKRESEIKVAFDELRAYDRSELSSYILLAVGRYIASTDNPFLGVDWFEEILGRETSELHPFADLELALIEAQSKDPAELDRAEARFRKIIDVYKTQELQRISLLGLMDLYESREDWENLLDSALKYQANRSFSKGRPKANYMIARAYEGKKELGRAQQAYLNVYVLYKPHLDWSPRAFLRTAEIEWNKGKDESRRRGYEMLRKVETDLGHLSAQDREGWLRRAISRLDQMREELGITAEMEAEEAKLKEAEKRRKAAGG